MNSRSLGRLFSLAVAVAALGFASGCTQVLVSPNVQGEYKLGQLEVVAEGEYERVYEAVKASFKDVGLFQTLDERKVKEAELQARASDDTRVTVKIKEVGPKSTSVKIRYGLISPDLAAAQRLYQAIAKRL